MHALFVAFMQIQNMCPIMFFSVLMWGPTLLSQGINSFCKLPHSLQYLFTFYVSNEPPNTKRTCTFWWMLVIMSTGIVSQLIKILRPNHNLGFKPSRHYIKTYRHVVPLRNRLVRFLKVVSRPFPPKLHPTWLLMNAKLASWLPSEAKIYNWHYLALSDAS